jgi:hypothetical protein
MARQLSRNTQDEFMVPSIHNDAIAKSYAVSLLLVGVALSQDGDRKRVVEQLVPSLLEGNIPPVALDAIQRKDKDGVVRFLAMLGVQLQDGELAVDAIIRTHLSDVRSRLQKQLASVDKAWKAEEDRAIARKLRNSEPDSD